MALPVLNRNAHRGDDARARSGDLPERRAESPVSQPAASRTPARERWHPMTELAELHERMGRLVGDLFGDTASAGWPARWSDLGWRPAADVEETDDAYLVEIELPAVKRDDVSVEVTPDELVVSGEIQERQRVGFLRTRTRRTGRFDFRVALPGEVDVDGVRANLTDGVLSVRIPKTETAKRRRIPISA